MRLIFNHKTHTLVLEPENEAEECQLILFRKRIPLGIVELMDYDLTSLSFELTNDKISTPKGTTK